MTPSLNVSTDLGRSPARPGPDHHFFGFDALPNRPTRPLPDGKTVAVSIVIDLAAVEWEKGGLPRVPAPGGRGPQPYPDYARMSHREYGHRTGVFRLVRMLRGLGLVPSVAVDVATAERYRPLLDTLLPQVTEVVAHGLSATRPITSQMSEDEERAYVQASLDRLETALGVRPSGWLSPQTSESTRTPGLLAAAGVRYVLDWAHDEQPVAMTGVAPDFWAVPLSHELSDLNAFQRNVSPADYGDSLVDALNTQRAESETSTRMLGLHLHPWISGQPFRTRALGRALERWGAQDDVWLARPGEIVEHWSQGERGTT